MEKPSEQRMSPEESAERSQLMSIFEGIDIDQLFKAVALQDRIKQPNLEQRKAAVLELLRAYKPEAGQGAKEYTLAIQGLLEAAHARGLIPFEMLVDSEQGSFVTKDDERSRLECAASFIVERDSVLKAEALVRECRARLAPFQYPFQFGAKRPFESLASEEDEKPDKVMWKFISEDQLAKPDEDPDEDSYMPSFHRAGRFTERIGSLEDRFYEVMGGIEIPYAKLEREWLYNLNGSVGDYTEEDEAQDIRIFDAKESLISQVNILKESVQQTISAVFGKDVVKSTWLKYLMYAQIVFVALTRIAEEQGRPVYQSPIIPLLQSYLEGTPIISVKADEAHVILPSARLGGF